MENPNIKTKVVHSQSKNRWNVIGTELGKKYKIASFEYLVTDNEIVNTKEKAEAMYHAQFVSECFNNSEKIIDFLKR